jgi:hypothetical protein
MNGIRSLVLNAQHRSRSIDIETMMTKCLEMSADERVFGLFIRVLCLGTYPPNDLNDC